MIVSDSSLAIEYVEYSFFVDQITFINFFLWDPMKFKVWALRRLLLLVDLNLDQRSAHLQLIKPICNFKPLHPHINSVYSSRTLFTNMV